MFDDQTQWVALPKFLDLNKKGIKYQDALTYIAIRSFMNNDDKKCFPAYETVQNLAGLSRNALRASIIRLKDAGVISYKVTKSSTTKNNSNLYSFESFKRFDQIPISFFDIKDLSYHEKGMLLCLRQFFPVKNFWETITPKDIADKLGVTENTLNPKFKSLIKKGYLSKNVSKRRKRITVTYTLSEKLKWIYGPGQMVPITEPFDKTKYILKFS